MDMTTKRRICELVSGIIGTDGELHPAELDFMMRVFGRFGIDANADDRVLSPTTTPAEAERQMKALPEDAQREAMDLLVQSSIVDGKVVPAERDFLVAVGRALDLDEDAVDVLVTDALVAG